MPAPPFRGINHPLKGGYAFRQRPAQSRRQETREFGVVDGNPAARRPRSLPSHGITDIGGQYRQLLVRLQELKGWAERGYATAGLFNALQAGEADALRTRSLEHWHATP